MARSTPSSESTGTRHPAKPRAAHTGATARPRARRGEGELLREQIIDAASDLLIEAGSADEVSTRAVARRVGCSSPALYLHFPDRASLLYAACERQFEKLGEVIEAALAGIDDPVERLRAGAQAYARFALDRPQQYRVMMLDPVYSENFVSSLAEMGTTVGFDAMANAVRDGMASGEFAPGDPVIATVLLWASMHGLVSLMIVKPGLDLPGIDVLMDQACQQFMDGLRARDQPPPAPARKKARTAARSTGRR